MEFVKEANRVKSATIIKNLKKRGMDGYYCETKEEVKELVLSLIEKDKVVGWGGSFSIEETGLKDALRENKIPVIDRDTAKTPEERMQLMKKALMSDVFLASTNAITMDGEMFNIDGVGNRIAAMCFGPDSVIIVAGMNKVVRSLDEALNKARLDATVPNCIRYNLKNPCAITGICGECLGDTTLCGKFLITRVSKPAGRIKVILVGEDLGF
jgi:L-lactate utilization protein LutB